MATYIQPAAYYPRFLPQSIRYAVENRGGLVGKEETLELARSGSVNETIRIVMCCLNDRPDLQCRFLYELTNDIIGVDDRTLKEFVVGYIEGISDFRVCVPRDLCGLNAQWDFREWDAHMHGVARYYSPPKAILLSPRCLLGLRHFIAARMRLPAYPLYIGIQEWAEDDQMLYWGHELRVAPADITLLEKVRRPTTNPLVIMVITDQMLA